MTLKHKLLFILTLLLLPTFLLGATKIPQKNNNVFVVDDFEDGESRQNPEWWSFGTLKSSAFKNDNRLLKGLEDYSLRLEGDPKEWYIGGIGTYLGIDAKLYNAMKLVIYGQGPNSGSIIIELYDDDNSNWIIEKHPNYDSQTKFDDVFRYNLKVNWVGWRVVMIPLEHFKDANPKIGDDLWNAYQETTSGGLIQMQLIIMAGSKNTKPDLKIDNIKFFNEDIVKIQKKQKPASDSTSNWW